MSETLVVLLQHIESAERELVLAKSCAMRLFVEAGAREPVTIPAVTHAFAEIRHSGIPCAQDEPPGREL